MYASPGGARRAAAGVLGLLAVLLPMVAAQTTPSSDSPWTLVRDQDGIKVYSQPVAGSDYLAIRASTHVEASLSQLLGLLDDVPACPRWIHNCLSPQPLAEPNWRERYIYLKNDLPWPYQDRALVLHSFIDYSTETPEVTVRLTALDDARLPPEAKQALPAPDGSVRNTAYQGLWSFRPASSGYQVSYQLHIDLGGSPPAMLANKRLPDTPLKTLAKLRTIVQEDKYRNFKLPLPAEYAQILRAHAQTAEEGGP